MKLEYKNILLLLLLAGSVYFAFAIKHDVCQILLAVSSLMISYIIARLVSKSILIRLILFFIISVVVCQLSVTLKMTQLNESNSTGALAADIVHGFKRIGDLRHIPKEIGEKGLCGFLENANYRYLTMQIFLPPMMLFLLKRESSLREKPLKKK